MKKLEVIWKGNVPVSAQFDDPFYSLEDGMAESKFVFLDGANVMDAASNKDLFVIGETGFGTGLNFLTTWQAWRESKPAARLIFISAEAFPMEVADMKKAHSTFPGLEGLSRQLCTALPPASGGFHHRSFDNGKVSLLLMYGEATEMFSQLNAEIDAWYLDGFAPAKNPDMWSASLFKRMAQLSKPKATVATFTAAGFVRRGLGAHGFHMSKSAGFGRKRERLVGSFTPHQHAQNLEDDPLTWSCIPASDPNQVVVIGDGIAGASVAYALARRSLKPLIIAPEASHSHPGILPAAILAPQLLLADPIEKSFFYSAFFHAVSHPAYQTAFAAVRGTKYVPTDAREKQKFKDILAQFKWGPEWIRGDGDGLILPKGGTVSPAAILDHLTSGINRINGEIVRLEKNGNEWHVLDNTGRIIVTAPTIVLAAGARTSAILAASQLLGAKKANAHPSVRPRGGQLEYVPAQAIRHADDQTITFGGYVSAVCAGEKGTAIRTIGSTHDKLSVVPQVAPEPTLEAREAILTQCRDIAGVSVDPDATIKSWTGIRATAPDHLPFAGPIPNWNDLSEVCDCLGIDRKLSLPRAPQMENGLYCLTALGSKGFQYGPLLGEYLAAMICGEPCPLPRNLHAKLHPARGYIRDIIRGKVRQSSE